jgi:hybrid polyketide synthase/nonribosomal peptide synthetase ACE1
LWSHEPEITQQDGRVLIPRLYHLKEANDRYNSRKRLIRKEAAPETSPVVIFHNESSYAVQASPPANTTLSDDFIIVNVQYSILAAIRLSFSSYSFLVFGSDANTGEKVCAISESNASQVKVPANWAVFCNIPASGGTFISTVAHNFMAQYICSLGYRGKTLIVHEPNWQLVPILRDHALRKGLDLLLTTSNLNLSKTSLIFVHPLSSQRELKFILPNNISAFVNLSEDSLGPEFLDALPSHCNCQIRSDFFGQDATLISQEPVEALQLIRNLSDSSNKQAISPPAMLALQDVISADRDFEPLTVIDWANYSSVPVTVQPVDATPLFANDRTYILFGLTSDLAQTLCHWMVRHGARYVAMTSRKPKVQQAWLTRVEALGATVKLFPKCVRLSRFTDTEC